MWGVGELHGLADLFAYARVPYGLWIAAGVLAVAALAALAGAVGLGLRDLGAFAVSTAEGLSRPKEDLPTTPVAKRRAERSKAAREISPNVDDDGPAIALGLPAPAVLGTKSPKPSKREAREMQAELPFVQPWRSG